MTTNNHPAHGPVSLDRLHQIREILSKAAAQSDGGNIGYAMADAVKVIDGVIAAFGAEPVADVVAWSSPNEERTCDIRLRRHDIAPGPLYTDQPAPVVPDEMVNNIDNPYGDEDLIYEEGKIEGWNACRAAMLQAGNSPVTSDGWVACVERMPSAGEQVLAYRPDAPESNDPLIKMATYVGGSAHGHGFDCYCKPTHWMPLPAAPQQEVKP
ncbi:TPA: DUF551 domain-containing protein [Citrobacter freundii]